MQRASSSTERTPLVQPTYMFESSMTRQYQKRLRNFQCAVCVTLMIFLSVALLVTVGYNLDDALNNSDDSTSENPIPEQPTGNLTNAPPELGPLLKLSWPLAGRPPPKWMGNFTPEAISSAVSHGKAELQKRAALEKARKPLGGDTPAHRAQRAAATGADVKPLADTAYAVEQATKMLVNGKYPHFTIIIFGPYNVIGEPIAGSGLLILGPADFLTTFSITVKTAVPKGGVGIGPLTTGFSKPAYCSLAPPPCPPSKYRTLNGTCNNLKNSLTWGVARTPFRRVLPADYGDGISQPRTGVNGSTLPSARDVSVTVHRPSYAHDSEFTVMLAVFGQFLDHDITATALSKGENSSALSCCNATQTPHPECFPVPLDVEDPFYQDYNLTCMEFVRSAPAPTCRFGPRQQLNQATAYIDGSTIYGYTDERATHLRTGFDGKLRMLTFGARELLPASTDPNDGCNTLEMNKMGRYCFETGDDRANENLHLTTMHLIWARQHNRVATELLKMNPTWDDETTYQEARRIIGAQMQHIAYSEFLPSILGSDVMWALNLTLKSENFSDVYNPTVDSSIGNHFAASAFRFAHTLLPGLIHSADLKNGSINYVKLHEMLFNPYELYLTMGPRQSVQSAINTPVHSVDPHVTNELSDHLFERTIAANSSAAKKEGPCGLDLVSLNIQRGRDHGLPPYPQWREHCGFPRPMNFTDLEGVFDELSMGRIVQIYQHVDDIDLYTGGLAEDPQGRLLGPTLTCLIADQFLRIKVGDRFWYENNDTEIGFTIEQLTEIRKTTLAGVICANEALLDQAQPRVMEAVSATNPLMDCMELPQPIWTPWKETPKV